MSSTSTPNVRLKVWIIAARPRTLALALATIGMGAFLAAAAGAFDPLLVLLAALTAGFLQILSNLANDYGDSRHGADSVERLGPARAVQSGQISAAQMRRAMGLFVVLALFSGVTLILLAFGLQGLLLGGLFALLGAAAIWAAIAYTASANPYGYVGLGDFFVFLFFGWVGTAGTYYLQVQQLDWPVLLPATSVGLLSVGVLNVNNIRDMVSDLAAGKYSVPVRLGRARARFYHWFLLLGALACAFLFILFDYRSPWQFLFLLSAPLLVGNGLAVQRREEPEALDPLLRQLSLSTLLFVLLFGVGLMLV